ncbi:MAG: hypothetical protein NUV91_10130 [Candidatus Omnitrophica bacterium]|nr:hypothetical protein [Candidatus Omnitrophota bacterium]
MNKELLIRVPESLYLKAKKVCDREYKSMSALIRELLLEKIQDTLSIGELEMLDKSRKEFKEGKGVSWRSVKRG